MRITLLKLKLIILSLFFLLSLTASARPLTTTEIPDALKPWQAWVLHGQEQSFCPFVTGNPNERYCAWPGALNLQLENNQGQFAQQWEVVQPSWIILPGDNKYWPLAVKANDKSIAVVDRDGKPAVWLEPGSYQISGQWQWVRVPVSLQLASETVLVATIVNGKKINTAPDNNSIIWLQQTNVSVAPAHVQTRVFRRLQDGVPITMTTQIELDIAGDNREIIVSPALLSNQLPLAITSDLPTRLDPNGQLRLQARAGKWIATIESRYLQPQTEFGFIKPTINWSTQEIWSIAQAPEIRAIDIVGGVRVDAAQYDVPNLWRDLPTIILTADEKVQIKTQAASENATQNNQLSLQRTAWLDFSGKGYTLQDQINGTMRRDWRLETTAPLILGRATEGGQERLITTLSADSATGVEVRNRDLFFTGVLRKNGDVDHLPISGWNQTFDSTNLQLHLPPGWMLFATTGADTVSESWMSQWKLLDIFLVLVIAVAAFRLQGRLVGSIALVTLLLTYHAIGAPIYVWLFILILLAIANGLPQPAAKRWTHRGVVVAYIVLIIIAVPFLIQQGQLVLYPQLEHPTINPIITAPVAFMAAPPPAPEMAVAPENARVGKMMMATGDAAAKRMLPPPAVQQEALTVVNTVTSDAITPPAILNVVDPKARIQTGPAIPDWRWTVVNMSWTGPVASDKELTLWLLGPWQTRLWHLLSVIGVIALAAGLLGAFNKSIGFSWRLITQHVAVWTIMSVGLFSTLLVSPTAFAADYPPQELLQQLRAGLIEPAECVPNCAEIEKADVTVTGQQVTIEFTIDAASAVAVPLLHQNDQLFLQQIKLDDNNAQLRRVVTNDVAIYLTPGVHQVTLIGDLTDATSVNINFATKPHWLTFTSTDWQAAGLIDGQLQSDSLQLTRTAANINGAQNNNEEFSATIIPPFVKVDRTLQLGLQWTMTTTVRRIAPQTGAITLHFPLLPGEAVTTEGIAVNDNRVLIALGADSRVISWQSTLPVASTLQWQATDNTFWAERWHIQPSYLWHVTTTGTPPIYRTDASPFWQLNWQPWPKQAITLQINKPIGVAGDTLTVDKVDWLVFPGKRDSDVALHLVLRSTLGDKQVINLPPSATITHLTANGIEQPIVQNDNQLFLTVQPGVTDVMIKWREASAIRTFFSPSAISVDKLLNNIRTTVNFPSDRWVLALGGPLMGPAVLFWSAAAILLIIAYFLGRAQFSPLKTRHWILLGLGTSAASPFSLFAIAAWLFALRWRSQQGANLSLPLFRAIQVGLVFLTVVVLSMLLKAIAQGLLGAPDMLIASNHMMVANGIDLNWYQDQLSSGDSGIWIFSLPVWVYQILMLLWALWLAFALVRWLRWGWECFSQQGLWRKEK